MAQMASVSEIFSSVQGEGIYAGERQIFVRFAGCPWRCDYCDTPESLVEAGHRQMSPEEVLKEVQKLRHQEIETVSLTGGEPLGQVSFLEGFLPLLRNQSLRIYLETSGTLVGALSRIVNLTDVVAFDIKLPSAIGRNFWKEHEESLRVSARKGFVKIVLTEKSEYGEVEIAASLLSRCNPIPPVVLQPSTIFNGVGTIPLDRMLKFRGIVEKCLPHSSDIRILPQLHKIWGIL